MTTYRTLFWNEHVIQNRESTNRVRVCESRGYSNTTETTQQQNNHNTCRLLSRKLGSFIEISKLILLHEKFLQFDWLRAVVFQLNLKYLHVKITNPLRVLVF